MQCPSCKGFSFSEKYTSAWSRAAAVVPFLFPVALFVTRSLWSVVVLAILFVALLSAQEMALHRAPLIATTANEVVYSRKWAFGFAALILIGAAIAVSFSWHAA